MFRTRIIFSEKTQTYRLLIMFTMILAMITIMGCNGDSNPIDPPIVDPPDIPPKGEIIGPDTIDEYSFAEYSIDLEGDSETTYQWSVVPETAGSFSHRNTASTSFHSAGVKGDSNITIQVAFGSGNSNPILIEQNVQVEENIQVDPKVIEVDPLPMSLKTISGNNDEQYTFDYWGDIPDVNVGDIMLGSEWGGYLRTVESVEDTGSSIIAVTTQATMEEAIKQGHVKGFLDFGGHAAKAERAGLVDRTGATIIEFDPLVIDFSGQTLYERHEDQNNYLKVSLPNGSVSFEPLIEIDMFFDFFRGMTYFKTAGTGTLAFDVDVLAEGRWEKPIVEEVKVGTSPTQYFWVGPIYGAVVFDFYAGVEFDACIDGDLTTGFDSSYSVTVGAEYNIDQNPAWRGIGEFEHEFNIHPLTGRAIGDLYARGYVRPEMKILFFGVVGPGVNVEPYLKATGHGEIFISNPEPCIDYELSLGVTSDISVLVEVLGIRFVDFSFRALELEVPIFEGEYPVGCPIEENQAPSIEINNCQRTLDEFTSSYTFRWDMSDVETPDSQLEVEIFKDSGWQTIANGSTSYTWSNISYGNHTFKVKVSDNGTPVKYYIDECEFLRDVIVDPPPPSVEIINCPGTLDETTSSYTFRWDMSHSEIPNSQLKVEVFKDGDWQSLSDGSTSYNWSDIDYGDHTFKVKVSDDGSPVMSDIDECAFGHDEPEDNQRPTVEFNNCPSTLDETTSSYTFRWNMSDAETPDSQLEVEIFKDNSWQTISSGSTSYTWSNINYGNHTFKVKVTDNGTPPKYEIDNCEFNREDPLPNQPPSVDINICPGTLDHTTTSYTFTWDMSDVETPDSQLGVKIDRDGDWIFLSDGSTSYTWSNISYGDHTIEVEITDDGSPVKWAVDECEFNRDSPPSNQAPIVEITNCPGTINQLTTSYTFRWDMSDPETPTSQLKVEISTDGHWETLPNGTTSYTWSNITCYDHRFDVIVYDNGSPVLSEDDMCDFTRQCDPVDEIEPNNTCDTANWVYPPLDGFSGNMAPGDFSDFFKFNVVAWQEVDITLSYTGSGVLHLFLWAPDGYEQYSDTSNRNPKQYQGPLLPGGEWCLEVWRHSGSATYTIDMTLE